MQVLGPRKITLALLVLASAALLAPQQVETNGDPLFELLPSSHTGVKFNNKLKDTKEHNIMIYSNFYGGAGVGVGDINNDGLLDLYFAGNQVADQLYLNQGDMVFRDITKRAGIKDDGGWSSGVVMGDVNGDGLLDIYVTRELYDDAPAMRRNKLYINQGNARFEEMAAAYGVDNDQRTRHAAFLDYDKDGDLDLFLCNQPPNPGDYSKFKKDELIKPEYGITLYRYDNDRYEDVTVSAGLRKTGFPNSVTAADLDNDGWTDLYVANDFWIEDWIFMNNGDGTFRNEIYERLNHISFSSMGVDAGDINNDGSLDLMVVDMAAEDNYRSKTNMSGMNPKRFWKVVADGGHHQYMFNMLFLNQGDGYFSDIAQLAGQANTDWSWSPLIADFDNDGWKDVHVTNGLMRDIRSNDASKSFPDYLESSLFDYLQKNPNPPADISVWDIVDINKALELVPSEKLSNYMFKNNGDLTFSKRMTEWGLDQKSFSHGSAIGDLDNDGDLDLIVSNINDEAFIYRNTAADIGDHHFLRVHLLADDPACHKVGATVKVTTGDMQQYVEITTVRGMYSTSETVAHFGLGRSELVDEVLVTWPDGRINRIKDLPANQTIDVRHSSSSEPEATKATDHAPLLHEVTAALGLDYRHIENDFDDYSKQVLIPHKMSTMGPCISVADANGDGLDDFFIGGASGQEGTIYTQTATGTFEQSASPDLLAHRRREDMGSAFLDVDLDGDQDLYVVSGGNEWPEGDPSYQDRLYLNDGQGVFTYAPERLPDTRFCGSKVVPHDFDADGDLDLVVTGRHRAWTYPEPAKSVLLLNEQGHFTDVTEQLAPDLLDLGMVNDAKWFDFDQDGKSDLVLVGEWMPLTVLKHTGDALQRLDHSQTVPNTKGWWFSLETADMDGDGDEDLILGNLGLNYKYKATESEPFEVYYYDFDDNGSKDVVLTYYNFGIQYPLRGRQCSSEQVPMIKEKFENYDLFASADVTKVYGANKLAEALHYEATNFASVYLENMGKGQYQMHSLPMEAQISSLNDLVVRDFNGDGHPDILAAGNLFSAEVETARADAGIGLVMLGDGEGGFTALSKQASGLFVPHDVKSLATLRSGDHLILLVGCNDDRMRAYRF